MKKIIWIVVLLILIIGYFFFFRKPFDLLYELDQLRDELEINENMDFNYTEFYRLEDEIDSIINVGEFEFANHLLDSLLINSNGDEFKYAWYFRKGKIFYLKSEFEEAEQNFTFAINSTNKMELQSYFWRSFSLAKLGKCKEAIEDFKFVNLHSAKFKDFEKDLYSICDSLNQF